MHNNVTVSVTVLEVEGRLGKQLKTMWGEGGSGDIPFFFFFFFFFFFKTTFYF